MTCGPQPAKSEASGATTVLAQCFRFKQGLPLGPAKTLHVFKGGGGALHDFEVQDHTNGACRRGRRCGDHVGVAAARLGGLERLGAPESLGSLRQLEAVEGSDGQDHLLVAGHRAAGRLRLAKLDLVGEEHGRGLLPSLRQVAGHRHAGRLEAQRDVEPGNRHVNDTVVATIHLPVDGHGPNGARHRVNVVVGRSAEDQCHIESSRGAAGVWLEGLDVEVVMLRRVLRVGVGGQQAKRQQEGEEVFEDGHLARASDSSAQDLIA
eukprot:scaffold600_cov279-Pinguiococcus_pyrenoidosus.AAC.5